MFVYVCGAVCQPGVYELPAESRAYEAVSMAGGLLENAQSDAVNLAEVLTDGQKLQILYRGNSRDGSRNIRSDNGIGQQ